MCNLYNISTNREAITRLTRALDRAGWNEPSRDVHPGTLVPVVRVGANGIREMVMATWGMPSPLAYVKNYDFGVTNIRNTSSPHWRRWVGPANRCVVPLMSCAEPNPAAKVAGSRMPKVWFAPSPERPVMFFARLWTPWRGVRRVRDGERDYQLFGFLTCEPNAVVAPIHKKAMPVILTETDEIDLWLSAPWNELEHLQR